MRGILTYSICQFETLSDHVCCIPAGMSGGSGGAHLICSSLVFSGGVDFAILVLIVLARLIYLTSLHCSHADIGQVAICCVLKVKDVSA